MTPWQIEQLENIRRSAEAGLRQCQSYRYSVRSWSRALDTFQHILDIYETIKYIPEPKENYDCHTKES